MEIHFKNAHAKEFTDKESSAIADKAIQKVTTLKKYLGKQEQETQVYVELRKISAAHQHGEIWRAHIALEVNGKGYNAEAQGEEPQQAIDRAFTEIKSEFCDAKKRELSLLHKGGVALKSLIRDSRNS